jgi:hypothetical protein
LEANRAVLVAILVVLIAATNLSNGLTQIRVMASGLAFLVAVFLAIKIVEAKRSGIEKNG